MLSYLMLKKEARTQGVKQMQAAVSKPAFNVRCVNIFENSILYA